MKKSYGISVKGICIIVFVFGAFSVLASNSQFDAERWIAEQLFKYRDTGSKEVWRNIANRIDELPELPASKYLRSMSELQLSPLTVDSLKQSYIYFVAGGREKLVIHQDLNLYMTNNKFLADSILVCYSFDEFVSHSILLTQYQQQLFKCFSASVEPTLRNELVLLFLELVRSDLFNTDYATTLWKETLEEMGSPEQAMDFLNMCIEANRQSYFLKEYVEYLLLIQKVYCCLILGNKEEAAHAFNLAQKSYNTFAPGYIVGRAEEINLYSRLWLDCVNRIDNPSALGSLYKIITKRGFHPSAYNPHYASDQGSIKRDEAFYNLAFNCIYWSRNSKTFGWLPYDLAISSKRQILNNQCRNNRIIYHLQDSLSLSWYQYAQQLKNAIKAEKDPFRACSLQEQADEWQERALVRSGWLIRPSDFEPLRKRLTTTEDIQTYHKIEELLLKLSYTTLYDFVLRQELDFLYDKLTINEPSASDITAADIAGSLAQKETAIEFVSFKTGISSTDTTTNNMALIVNGSEPKVNVVRFGSDQDIKCLIDSNQFSQKLFNALDSVIIPGTKRIYYSPSGIFHKIAFDSLQNQSGQRLIDKYDLIQLSSTVQVVQKINQKSHSLASVALFGDISYSKMRETIPKQEKNPVTYRSSVPSGGLRFGIMHLDNSFIEMKNICEQLELKGIKYHIYDKEYASEAALKSLSFHAPDIIHISTHGFYFSSDTTDEAMRRCGLLMAGANKAWITGECEPGQDDGILTAEEIATLDLSGCRMVVLSACETGLGDATDYEGVVGLQRAFKLAGVRTIVMSLWRVKDDVTALLMTRFYRHLLNDNLTPHEAMCRAQSEIRKDFPDPRDWAAFVVLDG